MKALLVDLDDTLLDYSSNNEVSWREACEAVGLPTGAEVPPLVEAIAAARRWYWDESGRHREGRRDMLGAWTTIAGLGLERIGLDVPTLAAAIAQDYASRRRASYQLFPGAWEGLIELRRRRTPLALVTNGDAREQRFKIERFDLEQFFDVIVVEGEFGAGKPEEAVYRHALQALGAPPTSCWMVGDHLEWDVAAPQRLGLTGVWVDAAGHGVPTGHPVKPDRVVRTFADFVAGL